MLQKNLSFQIQLDPLEQLANSDNLILLPTLNEEQGIGVTISEIKECFNDSSQPHFLVVDGNSTDKTVEVARNLGAEVLTQTGKGKGNAILCALNALNKSNNKIEYVILLDADHTYPPQYIPEMIEILRQNPRVGMVCGNRYNLNLPRETGGLAFSIGNKLIAFVHSAINGVNLQDPLTGLRVIRWSILKDWKPQSDGFDIEVELNNYLIRRCEIKEIDISYRERLGEKKLKVRDGFSIFQRMVKEAMTTFNDQLPRLLN
jgi:dolichol-phosphate hexosyltransferase